MAGFHPRLEALPDTIAVFPLAGALLLPQGRLPLNIFEPRYLAMVEDTLRSGRMFGMIQPAPDSAPTPGGPGLYQTGCLGRVTSLAETDDGRFLITLTGIIRFRVLHELTPHNGYRCIRAEFATFAADLDLTATPLDLDRPVLLASLRSFFRRHRIEANWGAIEQMDDATLVTTISMVCPFGIAEKQALLEAMHPADRASTLTTLLQMAAHASETTSRSLPS